MPIPQGHVVTGPGLTPCVHEFRNALAELHSAVGIANSQQFAIHNVPLCVQQLEPIPCTKLCQIQECDGALSQVKIDSQTLSSFAMMYIQVLKDRLA